MYVEQEIIHIALTPLWAQCEAAMGVRDYDSAGSWELPIVCSRCVF